MENKKNTKLGFFDLETLALLDQQSEWKTKPCKTCGEIPTASNGGIVVEGNEGNLHSIGMSVGVVRDTSKSLNCVYLESHAKMLVTHLHSVDLVIGYNIRRFDYIVLEKYGGTMLKYLPTFDMFLEVQKSTDQMISMANLAKRTLNIELDKLGANAVNKWWEEEKQEVIGYCILDVDITQKLFNHACREGYLKYWDWNERKVISIDTSYWSNKCRLIVQSVVPDVKCPIKDPNSVQNYGVTQ